MGDFVHLYNPAFFRETRGQGIKPYIEKNVFVKFYYKCSASVQYHFTDKLENKIKLMYNVKQFYYQIESIHLGISSEQCYNL